MTSSKSLNVIFFTHGTMGDIMPIIALSQRFKNKGHQCLIVAHEVFHPVIDSYGFKTAPLDVPNPKEALKKYSIDKLMSLDPISYIQFLFKEVLFPRNCWDSAIESVVRAIETLPNTPDLIIGGSLGSLFSEFIGRKFNIPYIQFNWVPAVPSAYGHYSMKNTTVPKNKFKRKLKRYYTAYQNFRLMTAFMPLILYWQEKLELKKPKIVDGLIELFQNTFGKANDIVYAWSTQLFPIPEDYPKIVKVFPFVLVDPKETKLEDRIERFIQIDLNKSPVYVGFGSFPVNDTKLTEFFVELTKLTNRKIIANVGWSKLSENDESSEINENLLIIDYAPHSILFNKCSIIVHHGGVGTTHEALRAGKPMVVCPGGGDQFFWGMTIESKKIGLCLRDFYKTFNVNLLADAINKVHEKEFIDNSIKFSNDYREDLKNEFLLVDEMISKGGIQI